jgi:hypothetical protein
LSSSRFSAYFFTSLSIFFIFSAVDFGIVSFPAPLLRASGDVGGWIPATSIASELDG